MNLTQYKHEPVESPLSLNTDTICTRYTRCSTRSLSSQLVREQQILFQCARILQLIIQRFPLENRDLYYLNRQIKPTVS